MAERTVWMRLGVVVTGAKKDVEGLFSDDSVIREQTLARIIKENKFNLCGDSYVPESSVGRYNERYGTKHKVMDYGFDV